MYRNIGFVLLIIFSLLQSCTAKDIKVGAEQPGLYLPSLKNKKVGLVVNNTSLVQGVHLVDYLLENEVKLAKIFAPEHGFRGDVSAGGEITDGVDTKTGLPVLSLYGKNKKPTKEHLSGLDVVVFDIQDVGCRFYTYISTLHLVMEACAENNVPLIVLDRPNPNGDYVAGPIRKPGFESFVGMDPIPIVHGCTVGELANMINGEGWHKANQKCELTVVPVKNYDHNMRYSLPERPSPNLPNDLAIRLYPSLCFFEATSVSVGRGTDYPFQVLGGLQEDLGDYEFTPRSIPGVALNPLNKDQKCYGVDLHLLNEAPKFTLKYFLDFYNKYENKEDFLTRERWLNLLAGTDDLIKQIRLGKSEVEILESWQPELDKFKELRKKYLLYPDFE
uniref:exo-beta-N-acetylmuramidase NamZ family protein n=1 Tax=uncultured Draconibacterium sp. TaxID=1573823 RepID=UPI0032162985